MHVFGRRLAFRLGRRFSDGGLKEAKLFVRNLPSDATAATVKRHFEPFCEVTHVECPKYPATGKSRCIAYVTIVTAEPQIVRDDMHGHKMGPNRLEVAISETDRPQPPKAKPVDPKDISLNFKLSNCGNVGDVLSIFESNRLDFNAVHASTALYKVGLLSISLRATHRPLLEELIATAAASLASDGSKWTPRELANASWGVAKIGKVDASAFFDAVAFESPKKLSTFNSQMLANTVWAFATADFKAPLLFEAIAAEAVDKVGTFTTQNLANTVWAFAKAGVEAPLLFTKIALEAPRTLSTFTPPSLANTAWAYATAGVEAPVLFDTVGKDAIRKIGLFTTQDLATLIYAYAKAGFEAPQLFEEAAALGRKKILEFNAQALAIIAWGFANAKVPAPGLFQAVSAEAVKKIATFDAHNLANISWAFASAGFPAPALFQAVALEAAKHAAQCTADDRSSLAWAFAKAGVEAPALFEALAKHEASAKHHRSA
mmetsp:Transcript_19301/g.65209  ORF Transcript_19301/g.65209 Transcript_19301/m.65209 type:complete len:488 (-) Transcript_19301:152-1615(-)